MSEKILSVFAVAFSISTYIMLMAIFVRLCGDEYTEAVTLIYSDFAVEMGCHEKQISLEENSMKFTLYGL